MHMCVFRASSSLINFTTDMLSGTKYGDSPNPGSFEIFVFFNEASSRFSKSSMRMLFTTPTMLSTRSSYTGTRLYLCFRYRFLKS